MYLIFKVSGTVVFPVEVSLHKIKYVLFQRINCSVGRLELQGKVQWQRIGSK